jgi:transposase InsO family protein
MRLQREVIDLAVLLDGYSRRGLGWALERSLEAEWAVDALRTALVRRQVRPGLGHHSDRGVPEAAPGDPNRRNEQGLRLSMSRRGPPYDQAQAESVMKTLKCEEVSWGEYLELREAQARIGHFREDV